MVWLNAGRKLDAPSNGTLSVYAAGQCHLTGPAGELKCSTPALAGLTARITGRAPAVRGHRAFWASGYLVWQYARDGWAGLMLPTAYGSPKLSTAAKREAKRDAVKIASHVRYGAATPPLVFPVQLTHLPSRWRVSSVSYRPDGGVLRASRYALSAGPPDLGADGGLEFETDLPSFTIDPATSHSNFCGQPASEIINGYRVVVTHQDGGTAVGGGTAVPPSQGLCAANADGLSLASASTAHIPPSAWPACSGTTCGCSAPTRRTGPRNPSGEQNQRPRAVAGNAACAPATPPCGEVRVPEACRRLVTQRCELRALLNGRGR